MTYIDKILKDFGIERIPLVDTRREIMVHIEHREVLEYCNTSKIDKCEFQYCYDDFTHNHVVNQTRRTNVDELLHNIRHQVETRVDDNGPTIDITSSIRVVNAMKKD